MAHPLRGETNASHSAKLKRMTSDYGEADKKDMQYAGVNKYKIEGPEDHIGFGADSDRPNLHGARRVRKPAGGNAFATYKRGGRVKHKASGGVANDEDIEQADIDQKLASPGRKRGGRVADHGEGKVSMSAKQPSQSTEPSPTPVDNRAFGGAVGKKKGKSKKGGTHVNIMIAPQHGQPGAQGPMPISAMPTPPLMPGGPKPPMGGPGMPPPGGPPGGPGLPVLPPGAAPPGAVPPGLAARPPIMPRKRGGRTVAKHHHDDASEDAAMIKHMVRKDALKPHGSMRAAGGRVHMTHLTAGSYSGEGRLEKAHQNKRIPPQKV